MVRVQKSSRQIEVRSPAYLLSYDADRPWILHLAAGTGQPIADWFVGTAVDPVGGRDELDLPRFPELSREDGVIRITFSGRSSAWSEKRYVFTCFDGSVEYAVEVVGRGRVETCRFGQGVLPGDRLRLGFGRDGFRSGYRRPFREVARGCRLHAESLFSARPNAAERDLRPWWEDVEIDLVDDPARDGGLDSFLPAPWAFALGLGEGQPWASVGLAPEPGRMDFDSFSYRGGETFGFELAVGGRVRIDGGWRSPALLFSFGARDAYTALRALTLAMDERGLLPPAGGAPAAWWRRPVFDGGRAGGLVAGAEALAALRAHGVEPGVVWLGAGWLPDGSRADAAAFIARQHHDDRRVIVDWPLWQAATAEDVRWALSAEGLNADGLRLDVMPPDDRRPSAQELHDAMAVVRHAARAAKDDALIVAPTVNPSFRDVVDMVPLGSLWSDRTTLAAALEHRAAIAALACPEALPAVGEWHAPSREVWRETVGLQASLGVPVVSHATRLDSGEALGDDDYELIQASWRGVRS